MTKQELLTANEQLRQSYDVLYGRSLLLKEEIVHLRALLKDTRITPDLLETLGRMTEALAQTIGRLRKT